MTRSRINIVRVLAVSGVRGTSFDIKIRNKFIEIKYSASNRFSDFDIVNFPFLKGDVLRSTSYGIYISQPIRFARVFSHIDDFDTRNKVLTEKLFKQCYRYHKLRKAFSKFYRRQFDLMSKYNVGLKHFFCKAIRILNFMATWCVNSKR